MGAGKTTIGRQLAKQLQCEFVDSDHDIEARTGVSIATIFEIEGEAGFRQRETQTLSELLHQDIHVIATGGGAILREENRALMKQFATVVYLKAPVSQQLHRTRHDKKRPLLQTANPKEKLEELMATRAPLYEEAADITINTQSSNVRSITKKIIDQLKQSSVIS